MQTIQIQCIGADGQVRAQADGPDGAVLAVAGYQPGDALVFSGPEFMKIKVSEGVAHSIVYAPDGNFTFPIPQDDMALMGFAPGQFEGTQVVSARAATADELSAYRNLALNPVDRRYADEVVDPDAPEYGNPTDSVRYTEGTIPYFPHAYANRVTRNEGCFYARNAIDGISTQGGHGSYPYHSWGGAVHKDLTLTVYFGRMVRADKIVLCLRSDYSLNDKGQEHDTYWNTAIIEFSDGTFMEIHPQKTGEPQEFPFDARDTEWVKLKRLDPVQHDGSLNFAALNEIEVWGTECADART